jgi:hypothetical protein
VVAAEELQHGVDDQEQAHEEERERGREVANLDGAVVAEGKARVRRLVADARGDQERGRRGEAQHVLEPRALHGLRRAEREEDGDDRGDEIRERDPFEPDRLALDLLELGW